MANQKTTMSEESKNDLVKDARELLSKATPWPWTRKPGAFWICDVGNTGCGVWSTAYPLEGEPFPHAEQEADAALLARAPELLSALCDEVERLHQLVAIQSKESDGDLTTIGKALEENRELRSLNSVQAENIEHMQSQLRVMKEAIRAAMKFLRGWFGKPENFPVLEQLVAQLEIAITPKGSGQ